MIKPETITEEDEDEVAEAEAAEGGVAAGDQGSAEPSDDVVDKEVADWVKDAIDKRRRGVLGKAPKPALHAAPLDAVSSPSQDGAPNGLDAAGAVEVPTT
jgi:mitogen-activated protein kinase kinase